MTPARIVSGLVVVSVLASAACERAPGTVEPSPEILASTYGATLVECPSSDTHSTSGTIDTMGGSVTLGGHALSVPRFGVLLPTEFSLTDPASNYLMLKVRANGAESFEFEQPATITIDYSRCTRSNINKGPLSVWKINSQTKELLYPVEAVDDKEAHTVTFTTETLSAYAIAN